MSKGTLLSGIASGLNAVVQPVVDIINTNKTIKANKQLAEYSYSKDLEMWNRQNDYNSPLSQMNRYKEAGLNPNLIYGQGTSGNASTMPKYNAPTLKYEYSAPNTAQMLSAYQDYQLRQAQIDNVNASTKGKLIENAVNSIYSQPIAQEKYENLWQSKELKTLDNMRKTLDYNIQSKLKDTTIGRYQAELKRKLLDNAIRDIDLNWTKAEKWLNVGKTVGNVVGINRLGSLFKPIKPPSYMDLKRKSSTTVRYY